MTSTENLYYDYVIRGLSRREFLDALATEETDAVVVNSPYCDGHYCNCRAASVPLADERDVTNADR